MVMGENAVKIPRDFPYDALQSSVKVRIKAFDRATEAIEQMDADAVEPLLRGLSKIILSTLPCYTDSASRFRVFRFIKFLAKNYNDTFAEVFIPLLSELCIKKQKCVVTPNTSKAASEALKWAILVGASAPTLPPTFPGVLGMLAHAIRGSRLENTTDKKLFVFCKSVSQERLKAVVNSLTMQEQNVVCIGLLVKTSRALNIDPKPLVEKKTLLDLYIKYFLLTKEKKSNWCLERAAPALEYCVDEDSFKSTLLPAIQKSILRSPEIAIEAVGYTLKNVQVDLSDLAVDIGKILGPNLSSQYETTRYDAKFAAVVVADKISKCDSLKSYVSLFFDIFNGVNGKLTVAEHKMGILESIRKMHKCGVKEGNDLISLSEWIVDKTVTILQSESHEGTVIECLDLIANWSIHLGENCPEKLKKYFLNSLPSAKSPAKTYICKLLVALITPQRFHLMEPGLMEIVIKALEKSASMHSQVHCVSETVALSILLLRAIEKQQTVPDSTVAHSWSILSHVNEKFMSCCYGWSLLHVAELCTLILKHKKEHSTQHLYFAFALVTCSPDYHIRDEISKQVTKFFEQEEDPAVFGQLLLGLNRVESRRENIPTKLIKETLLMLAQLAVEPKRMKSCSLDIVDIAHRLKDDNLWSQVATSMSFDFKKVASVDQLVERYVTGFEEWKSPALTTVNIHVGRPITDAIITEVLRIFKDPDIANVSRDDYFIFRTEEGHLYDNSVLETSDSGAEKNLKRESKVYSYKEQLEEIQLRKELEEKQRLSGKGAKLTPKQKEAMKVQLEKESKIRAEVKVLDAKLKRAFGLLGASLQGDKNGWTCLSSSVHRFIEELLMIMTSAVAAPYAVKFYLELTNVISDACDISFRNTFTLLAQIGLRVMDPKCDYLKINEHVPLEQAIADLLEKFERQLTGNEKCHKASASIFSLMLPLYDRVLIKYPTKKKLVADLINNIQMLLEKITRDKNLIADSSKCYGRPYVTRFLYDFIENFTGLPQRLAVNSLLMHTEGPDEKSLNSSFNTSYEFDFITTSEVKAHVSSLYSELSVVRETAAKCLFMALRPGYWPTYDETMRLSLITGIYRASHDSDSNVASAAQNVWDKYSFEVCETLISELQKDVLSNCEEVRSSAARGLGDILKSYDAEVVESVMQGLVTSYCVSLAMIPPVKDELGRILEPEIDRWEARCGVALGMHAIAPLLTIDAAEIGFAWIVKDTLSDRSLAVHNVMLEAAVELVKVHGSKCLNNFITIIEKQLETAGNSSQYDNVRQACVVLMGCLARHLDPDDERVKSIFGTLLDTLSTPSEKVQEATANCLPPLVPAVQAEAAEILDRLCKKLMTADTYGERRGAAYGLAGMIKGLGILSLKHHDVMNLLAEGMQDKKNYKKREGSLMALELLCDFLGRLFEPYIVHVLPYLLQCLGDSNQYVREATENTSKRVMSRLSAHGVKLVLPALLTALNEDSWRTKCGSVDLLGRMAYCAPRQLSGCLPMIVPMLIDVLGDSHVRVQEAASNALSIIGSVIRNPEIQSVVPILLRALQDPGKQTSTCLQHLLKTEFVHMVDPPSLALIMPVVQRAFNDRSTENRKMAAQIIGNMYSLTDPTDLGPYMDKVMPGLKTSLVDPVPEVRAVAAKALGAMAKSLGESCYQELIPWLLKTLVSEANSVDRSGAAQGFAEIIGALGEEKLHSFMPEIIRKADSDNLLPHVRDGYMMMFIYVPSVFEDEFVPYIGQIINPILKALADENEFVRETALRAGQRIVTGFAESAITLLLPELEKGVFDDNWRIRFSSVQLLGDLLYKISGVSGKMSTESASDDDNFGTEQSQKAIIAALGLSRRNRVLAGLYMGRSDVALMVRQAALHVWKVVVANTPKTLREILPTLFSLLLGCLASSSPDKRQVAARTLGDLVRKLGEKILPEIIPILEKGLESEKPEERQGVCIGLSEIMASTNREMVMAFVDNLVPTLRRALCDPEPRVREAAAQTFGSLHTAVGSRALDEILPFMMKKLDDPEERDFALDGLGQVLIVKSKSVLPYLIPQLIGPPPNTSALGILSTVAGDAMSRHVSKILPCLMDVLNETVGTPREQEELDNCEKVLLSINDEYGVRLLIDELMDLKKSENKEDRRAAITLLSLFCVRTKADLSQFVAQLLRTFILLLNDPDPVILKLSSDAIGAIVKNLSSADKLLYVSDVRQALSFVQSDLKGKSELPGLCIPKGVAPILPIFREALLGGTAEAKEQASMGMGEMINLSNELALKPSVIHITGPLIRILGDRYGASVKVAVIETLTLLLHKVGNHLKAFLPQLQTTFIKATLDPARNVRLRAARALAELVPIHSKPDPLFQDLIAGVKSAEDLSTKDTMLYTIRCTVIPGGEKMTEATRKTILASLYCILNSSVEALSTRLAAATCLGAMSKWAPEIDSDSIFQYVLSNGESDPNTLQTKTTAVVIGLKEAPEIAYVKKRRDRVDKVTLSMLASDKPLIAANGVRACGYIFQHCILNDEPVPSALVQPFCRALNNTSNEVKMLVGHVSEVLARRIFPRTMSREMYRSMLPALVNGTKEKNSMVRAACESALVWILHLRHGENTLNMCLDFLETGAKESLTDVVNKVLRKVSNQAEGKEPDIDDTILG